MQGRMESPLRRRRAKVGLEAIQTKARSHLPPRELANKTTVQQMKEVGLEVLSEAGSEQSRSRKVRRPSQRFQGEIKSQLRIPQIKSGIMSSRLQSLGSEDPSLGLKSRLQLKQRTRPLNHVNADVAVIRAQLEDAFYQQGINYQNRSVTKPVTKQVLITLVEAQFGLSLNVHKAMECILFCKRIHHRQLKSRRSGGEEISVMNTEFDLDKFAEWLSANVPKMHTTAEATFKLPSESAKLSRQ